MDLLFKIFTPRNLLISVVLSAAVYAADCFSEYPQRLYREWRYPPQKGIAGGGDDILILLEKRAARKVQSRHERVMGLLAQARQDGFEVDKLQRKAAAALALNTPKYRSQAVTILTEVEMAVPRKKTQYIPMYPSEEEDEPEVPEDVQGKKVGKRRAK